MQPVRTGITPEGAACTERLKPGATLLLDKAKSSTRRGLRPTVSRASLPENLDVRLKAIFRYYPLHNGYYWP